MQLRTRSHCVIIHNRAYMCSYDALRASRLLIWTQLALLPVSKYDEAVYPKRDVIKARAARQLQRRFANPLDAKLKRALSQGQITHSDVFPANATRATEIYGPGLEALKGRTTCRKALPFPRLDISARATIEQSVYVDLFYDCKEAFLITKVLPLGRTMVTALDKADTISLRRVLWVHLVTYGQRRITNTTLYSNNDRGITAMASDFAGAGITLHQSGPGIHVHVIERTIRHIKELARGTLSGLPYNCRRWCLNTL